MVLSAFSVAWGAAGSVVAVALAYSSGSVSLLGFGIDAAIDSIASVALLWRFSIEGRDPERAVRVEHSAERIVGAVLVVAAVSLAVGAVRALLAHSDVAASISAVALLVASIVVLPPLAIAKHRVAAPLSSGALRADAVLTGAAAILAAVSLVSILLSTIAGVWWADAVGALLNAVLLASEGMASVGMSRSAG